MEVHHHSHTARKKWTHYFWEFFMLFLAVTLGFFVENQREHFIEHKRAGIYARAMINNLKSDTSELGQIIFRGEIAANYLDSFLNIIKVNEINTIPSGKLYWFGLWGGYLRGFEPNDATFQQMKNSGSLRYFTNYTLEQQLGEYDQILRSMKTINEIDRQVYIETRKARAKIFDFRYNDEANKIVQSAVYAIYDPVKIDSFIRINPPLLTTDKILINDYAEMCRSRNLKAYLRDAKEAYKHAHLIIGLLKKEFHLE